jgi:hypothetical protein
MENPIEQQINKVLEDNSPANSVDTTAGIKIQKKQTRFWIAAILFSISIIVFFVLALAAQESEGAGLVLAPIGLILILIALVSLIYMIISFLKTPPKV